MTERSDCLRVLTLNTWNREGEYAVRAQLIRAALHDLAPDVLGFQEVEQAQVSELLEGFGYHHVWHGHGTSGMAIASRWPLRDADAVDLPPAKNDPVGGIVQRALVHAPFGVVPFVNTTTYYPAPQEGWKREPQMPALHAHVRDLQRKAVSANLYPAIMVGDFNTVPESNEIRFLTGLHAIDGRSAYYCDAWARANAHIAHVDGSGTTWTRRNPASATWGLPDRRIDFIFIAAPGMQGAGAVRACRVVCDAPEQTVWPSDHLGVFAELSITD